MTSTSTHFSLRKEQRKQTGREEESYLAGDARIALRTLAVLHLRGQDRFLHVRLATPRETEFNLPTHKQMGPVTQLNTLARNSSRTSKKTNS